jgi:hypothetical protein
MPGAIIQPSTALLITLISGILVGVLIGRNSKQAAAHRGRSAWNKKHRKYGMLSFPAERMEQQHPPSNIPGASNAAMDAADQLRIVLGATFSVQPLLNASETRVFWELRSIIRDLSPSWQVMAQVSLGEILQCKDPRAFSCINSKRVDLLLVDDNCRPRHVVEYHGAGHYRSSAAARDAIKKEALRKAGITYHEVLAGETTPSDLRRLVEKLIGKVSVINAVETEIETIAGQQPVLSNRTNGSFEVVDRLQSHKPSHLLPDAEPRHASQTESTIMFGRDRQG